MDTFFLWCWDFLVLCLLSLLTLCTRLQGVDPKPDQAKPFPENSGKKALCLQTRQNSTVDDTNPEFR